MNRKVQVSVSCLSCPKPWPLTHIDENTTGCVPTQEPVAKKTNFPWWDSWKDLGSCSQARPEHLENTVQRHVSHPRGELETKNSPFTINEVWLIITRS